MQLVAEEKTFEEMVAERIVDTFYVPNPKFNKTDTVCRYNGAIDCSERGKCQTCGFNPYNRELHIKRVEAAMLRRDKWLEGRW